MSLCLCVCVSMCLCVWLCLCLCLCLCVCVCPCVSVFVSACLRVDVSMCRRSMCLCPRLCPYRCLCVRASVRPCVRVSVCPCVRVSVCPCVHVSSTLPCFRFAAGKVTMCVTCIRHLGWEMGKCRVVWRHALYQYLIEQSMAPHAGTRRASTAGCSGSVCPERFIRTAGSRCVSR